MFKHKKKIFSEPYLLVASTCFRLPVFTSHAESVYVEVDKEGVTVEEMWEVLSGAEGIVLQDDPSTQTYPTPLSAADKEDVFVGRVRKDLDNDRGFHLWVGSDNLIKGAALNTVQIAQTIIKKIGRASSRG